VNERRDDTTKPRDESRPEPGRYYYDDATGYEVYDSEKDNEDEDTERPTEENGSNGS
jgi:hypothetical protein